MIGNLAPAEIESVLRQENLGHLGVWDGERVHVFPINYGYDGAAIYLHSHDGLKVRAMRKHPEVCLQVEQIITPAHWRSVMVHGSFAEIVDETDRDTAFACIVGQGSTVPPSIAPYVDGPEGIVVYRIQIAQLDGRYEQSEVLALRHRHGPGDGGR